MMQFEKKEGEVEEVLTQYQMRQQQLRAKAMEDAQKVVLKQVLSDVVNLIDEEKQNILEKVSGKFKKNKEEIDEVKEDVEGTQEQLEIESSELRDKISDAREDLEKEIDFNSSLFNEEISKIDDQLKDETTRLGEKYQVSKNRSVVSKRL